MAAAPSGPMSSASRTARRPRHPVRPQRQRQQHDRGDARRLGDRERPPAGAVRHLAQGREQHPETEAGEHPVDQPGRHRLRGAPPSASGSAGSGRPARCRAARRAMPSPDEQREPLAGDGADQHRHERGTRPPTPAPRRPSGRGEAAVEEAPRRRRCRRRPAAPQAKSARRWVAADDEERQGRARTPRSAWPDDGDRPGRGTARHQAAEEVGEAVGDGGARAPGGRPSQDASRTTRRPAR